MILTYQETINGKKYNFSYDSEKVKGFCVDCEREIKGWQTHENYRQRGNFCSECNGKYQFTKSLVNGRERDFTFVLGFHP